MIYTVTLNPAIDYVLRTDRLRLGEVNRVFGEMLVFGGKGINVSLMLARLGVPSAALGFTAGFTGKAIEEGISGELVRCDFVRLKEGFSRINVKLHAEEETEINGSGPEIPPEALEEFFTKLDKISDGDTLLLAGSVPGSLPADIYEKCLERVADRRVKTVVDAAGELLMRVLKYKPFLVKPNLKELGDLFGVSLSGAQQAEEYARRLQSLGAANVLVSMAGDGAVFVGEDGSVLHCGVCKGEVVNSVGAGDSMVAGFLAGLQQGGDIAHALRLGTAAGGATAFSQGLGSLELINRLLCELG